MFQEFDEVVDKKFYDLCQLDENPIICTEPVEESKYLGVDYYTSEEGFQPMIEIAYQRFIAFLDQFIQHNVTNDRTYLLATLNRLMGKYHNLQEQFNNSTTRLFWLSLSKYFTISNADVDYNINKKQNYTREAYRFFNKMSGIQLFFIEKTIDYLNLQISSFTHDIVAIKKTNKAEHMYFTINSDVKNSDELLEFLYDRLVEEPEPFINCKKREFKKLFIPSGETAQPIIWNKDYIHLSYLIKQLTNKIVIKQTAPSQYEIAIKLFFNKVHGIYFAPSRFRHNTDPAKREKDKIDSIISYAEKTYLTPPDTKRFNLTNFNKTI